VATDGLYVLDGVSGATPGAGVSRIEGPDLQLKVNPSKKELGRYN